MALLVLSWVATELVALLSTISVIFSIPTQVMGLTIFALGNSVSDLISNTNLAQQGFVTMALSACFASPMLNLVLGVGLSVSWYAIVRGGGVDVKVDGVVWMAICGVVCGVVWMVGMMVWVWWKKKNESTRPFHAASRNVGRFVGVGMLVVYGVTVLMGTLMNFIH